MEVSVNKKAERVKGDVLYHLDNITSNARRLQLDYNRDMAIWFNVENTVKEINIVTRLLQTGISPAILDLRSQVNELFIKDPNLSIVLVKVVNTNRNFNKDAMAYLNFVI